MLISSAVYWSQGSCERAPALRPTWKWEDYAGKTQKRLFLDLCIFKHHKNRSVLIFSISSQAKAVAMESNATFFNISAASLTSKYVSIHETVCSYTNELLLTGSRTISVKIPNFDTITVVVLNSSLTNFRISRTNSIVQPKVHFYSLVFW